MYLILERPGAGREGWALKPECSMCAGAPGTCPWGRDTRTPQRFGGHFSGLVLLPITSAHQMFQGAQENQFGEKFFQAAVVQSVLHKIFTSQA